MIIHVDNIDNIGYITCKRCYQKTYAPKLTKENGRKYFKCGVCGQKHLVKEKKK